MKHLLNFENEDKQYLEKLVDEILKIDLEKLNKINSFALLQFNEPSTRTRLSFSIAAKKLGIEVLLQGYINERDFFIWRYHPVN